MDLCYSVVKIHIKGFARAQLMVPILVTGLHTSSGGGSSGGQQGKKKKNAQTKKAKEDAKVTAIFREQKKPVNEFESWCTQALQNLHAQIDIPTFMAFLNDIESPYEVSRQIQAKRKLS